VSNHVSQQVNIVFWQQNEITAASLWVFSH